MAKLQQQSEKQVKQLEAKLQQQGEEQMKQLEAKLQQQGEEQMKQLEAKLQQQSDQLAKLQQLSEVIIIICCEQGWIPQYNNVPPDFRSTNNNITYLHYCMPLPYQDTVAKSKAES